MNMSQSKHLKGRTVLSSVCVSVSTTCYTIISKPYSDPTWSKAAHIPSHLKHVISLLKDLWATDCGASTILKTYRVANAFPGWVTPR